MVFAGASCRFADVTSEELTRTLGIDVVDDRGQVKAPAAHSAAEDAVVPQYARWDGHLTLPCLRPALPSPCLALPCLRPALPSPCPAFALPRPLPLSSEGANHVASPAPLRCALVASSIYGCPTCHVFSIVAVAFVHVSFMFL